MRYVTSLLVTGGATGHRFKDQLTARVASELYDLTYVHSPFPKDLYDEHLWEEFLGFGDDHPKLYEIDFSKLKQVRIDKNAWRGSDFSYIENIIKSHPEDNVIFIFTESARILVEQVEKSIRDRTIGALKEKYWNRRAISPIKSYFSENTISVALHVRRGKDVTLDKPTKWRFTKNNYYIKIIKNLIKAIPHPINFHIYSEGVAEEFKEFTKIPGVFIHLCPWPPANYNDLFNVFHHMITADILVTATSEFSYFLSHMSSGYVLTLPMKGVVKLPIDERFAKTTSDGSFDEDQLRNYLFKTGKITLKNMNEDFPHAYKAFIKADTLENPYVINTLYKRLLNQGITPMLTDKKWQDIDNNGDPFLYYRNPYLRFDKEKEILQFHHNNDFPFIQTQDEEIISVNPASKAVTEFNLNDRTYLHNPSIEPLPILLGTHQRPLYLELTLNSLIYNTKHIPDQKIYIVASAPDDKTKEIITRFMSDNENINTVLVEENIGYGLTNFGAKFYKLKKFIHFEDDGILPDSTCHLLPYWTKQLNYRTQTAGLVGFRISEQNRCAYLHTQREKHLEDYRDLSFTGAIWNYFTPQPNDLPPISGLGLVIDSNTMYRDFKRIGTFQTDLNLYNNSDSVCIIDIPVYHLGANQKMDYGLKATPAIKQHYIGMDLKSRITQQIDLLRDWSEYA